MTTGIYTAVIKSALHHIIAQVGFELLASKQECDWRFFVPVSVHEVSGVRKFNSTH